MDKGGSREEGVRRSADPQLIFTDQIGLFSDLG